MNQNKTYDTIKTLIAKWEKTKTLTLEEQASLMECNDAIGELCKAGYGKTPVDMTREELAKTKEMWAFIKKEDEIFLGRVAVAVAVIIATVILFI